MNEFCRFVTAVFIGVVIIESLTFLMNQFLMHYFMPENKNDSTNHDHS